MRPAGVGGEPDKATEVIGAMLRTLARADRFPALYAALVVGAFAPVQDPTCAPCDFGLDLMLDGIDHPDPWTHPRIHHGVCQVGVSKQRHGSRPSRLDLRQQPIEAQQATNQEQKRTGKVLTHQAATFNNRKG